MSTSTKIYVAAALVFLAIGIYLRNRDTPNNNIRKARDYHRKAVEFHESGKEDEATKYFSLASEYRQKKENNHELV